MESLSMQLQPFFEWLLRTTLQASLLIFLILLFQAVLRSRLGARWHYCLWLLLLIRMVMPWAPQSRLSVFNLIPQSVPQRQTEYARQEVGDDSADSVVTDKSTAESTPVSTTGIPQDSQEAITETPQIRNEDQGRLKPVVSEIADILPLVWLAGALILVVYVCAGNFHLWWLVTRERPLTDQKILDLLEDCKARMGIRIILGVVTTDKVKSPSLFGFIRPRLLLPKGMLDTLSREELRYVFLHELAHLKRHDIYIGWLISLLQVLHWFNPLIWLAFYRMRADRELACDALVLARTQSGQRKDYGRTIVSLLERFSQPRRLPSMAGILETKTQLKRRIKMIARFKKNSYQWSPLAVFLVIILGCILLPDRIRSKASEKPLRRAKAGPTLRRVMDCTANAAVSADNRLVCYPKYDESGELVVHNLVTGKEHIIKASAGAAGHESDPLWPVFSPDGGTIAYMVVDEQENPKWEKIHPRDLYLIGTDGSNKRLLCRGNIPIVWSSDGKRILVTIASKDDPSYIVWVSTEDGSIEKRVEFPKRWQAASPSPDGRYLAFDRPQEGDPNASWFAGRWDIFALDFNTGQESAIACNPACEVLLGWAPSGKHILFLSDRMGTWDAWLQPVADAVPAGQTQLVCRNLGHVRPGRFSQDGSYYYQVAYNSSRIYFGEIDLHTAQVVSAPKALEGTGFDTCVDWSPDGRFAAYCSRNPDRPGPFTIHIHDVAAGTERRFELDAKLEVVGYLRWSPDGKSLLISSLWNYTLGPEYNEKEGIDSRVYRIDIKSGKGSVLMQSKRRRVKGAELSPDGKTLFYSCSSVLRDEQDRAGNSLLIRRDLASGEEKPLFEFSAGTGWSFAVSRSGEFVAIAPNEQKGSSDALTKKIMVIPSAGGQITELVRWDETPGAIWGVAWTPDGNGIVFVLQRDINDDTTMELWYVLTDASPPRKIMEADLGGWSGVRVHPDGRRIAFDAARSFYELWVMENFLPRAAAPVAKPAQQSDFRKIWIPTKPGNGVLSPDGKKLAFVSKRRIWVVPVHGKVSPDIAGEPVMLPGTEGAWRWGMSWSADGKWIAYNNLKNDEICVVPSSGGKVKRISVNKDRGGHLWNYRLSLSPDGKIVAFASKEKEKIQLFTVNVEGADVNQLTEDGGTQPAFSPDGKKITYVKERPQKRETPESDVWVISVSGGTPVQVSDLPGRAIAPIWSPDGKMIAFTRTAESDGSKEICIVPVSEAGNPEASPTQIELPLVTWNFLAGWTPDNKIGVLLTEPVHRAIYTVPASGGNAVQVTPAGWPCHPRWSPDGERIYFRWGGGDLASVPSEGGEISTAPLDADSNIFVALPGGGNAVSPDGKKIVFAGAELVLRDNKKTYDVDIYTIPVQGGEPKKLTVSPGQDRFPCWSPDGKLIAFIRYAPMNICIVPTEGGEVRQLTSESHRVLWSTIAWSPDGKSIAYFSEDKAIKVIPVQGGQPRIVVKVGDVNSHSELAWSPDGSKLVYSSKGSIWAVSPDGGKPEEIKTGLDAKSNHISWSPDGKKIAFSAAHGGNQELWLMENFLSTGEVNEK